MFIRKIKLNSTLFGYDNIKHFLRFHNHSDVDPNLFFNKLRDEYSSLTPIESVLASNYLDKIFCETYRCGFSSRDVFDLKKQLVNNIRSKLYSLSDLNELCNVTILISKSGILTKSYVSDFLSRLDKLIVSINFDRVSSICDSLNLLHKNGYMVDNVCVKFYNVLISDNILEKLDNLDLVKLFDFIINSDINNVILDNKIVSVIKDRLGSNSIPNDVIASIVELNHFKRSKLYFINPLLVGSILKDDLVSLSTAVKCLSSCKDYKHDLDTFDKLYLSNKDEATVDLKLHLLDNFARFKYKPTYLTYVVDEICQDLLQLKFDDLLRLFKNIYELNLNEKAIIERFRECLSSKQSLEYSELYCDVLLAMCYFRVDDHRLYNSLLYEIIRNEYRLKDSDKVKLQILHNLLRCDYMDNHLIGLIDSDIKNYLDNLTDYYEAKRSFDYVYVSNLILSLSHTIYERVKICGFYLDFIRPHRRASGTFIPSEHGFAVLIEELYRTDSRPSNSPDYQPLDSTSTHNQGEECSNYLLMKNVLDKLNVKYLCVSMCVIGRLNRKQRLEYIKMLLSKHVC